MNSLPPELVVLMTRQFDQGRSALPDAPVVPEKPARSAAREAGAQQAARVLRRMARSFGHLADKIERPVRAA